MNQLPPEFSKFIPLLIPILVIQLGLQIFALIDLYRQPKTSLPKWVWVIIILLGEIIGPILYFIVGRKGD